jgi:hypothetical protein
VLQRGLVCKGLVYKGLVCKGLLGVRLHVQ